MPEKGRHLEDLMLQWARHCPIHKSYRPKIDYFGIILADSGCGINYFSFIWVNVPCDPPYQLQPLPVVKITENISGQLIPVRNYPFKPENHYLGNFSEVSKRGWRTEGVGAKKSLLCQ